MMLLNLMLTLLLFLIEQPLLWWLAIPKELFLTHGKELMNLDSLVAEASAILWAMELATVEGFGKVTIESDAKVCIDELLSSEASSNWKISALIGQSLALVSRFSFCDFQWVRRDANLAAHALAKVAFSLRLPF